VLTVEGIVDYIAHDEGKEPVTVHGILGKLCVKSAVALRLWKCHNRPSPHPAPSPNDPVLMRARLPLVTAVIFFVLSYSHVAYLDYGGVPLDRFPAAVRALATRCKLSLALRPGLSQEIESAPKRKNSDKKERQKKATPVLYSSSAAAKAGVGRNSSDGSYAAAETPASDTRHQELSTLNSSTVEQEMTPDYVVVEKAVGIAAEEAAAQVWRLKHRSPAESSPVS
jgi:hypothetical protein